jgi:glucosamine-6-phosphate deaminase
LERYEAVIRESGGIDVCVLGIGRNGHIGFNEPGAPFGSRTRVLTLSENTRLVNAGDFEANRAPERSITVGMATISEAREVLLLASGTNKAGAIAAALEGEVSESMPASMLKRHQSAVLFLDADAASDLGHGVAG